MTQTLVLIRHGHRDTSRRELDNGLDEKGRDQAKAIKRFFSSRFAGQEFKNGLWIVSSPRVRCMETLLPTAKELGRSVDSHPDLLEQTGRENAKALLGRVQRFLGEWRESRMSLTLVCSHGDWLPLASQLLLGLHLEHKKGSWMEVEREGDHHLLKWHIPSFKPLS
jgi:broad specificity phosphatase PhoE